MDETWRAEGRQGGGVSGAWMRGGGEYGSQTAKVSALKSWRTCDPVHLTVLHVSFYGTVGES